MSGPALPLRFVRLREGAQAPARASAAATGFDVRACLPDPGFVDVGVDPICIPTGLAFEVPPGVDAQIRPRSGLAARGVIATFGTLDPDYRGELLVTLYTVGRRPPHRVRHGDRIAQLVVARTLAVEWTEVAVLNETARGAGGHGSTGR